MLFSSLLNRYYCSPDLKWNAFMVAVVLALSLLLSIKISIMISPNTLWKYWRKYPSLRPDNYAMFWMKGSCYQLWTADLYSLTVPSLDHILTHSLNAQVLRLYGTYQTPHQLIMVTEPLNYGDMWNVIYEVTPYCEQDGSRPFDLKLRDALTNSLTLSIQAYHCNWPHFTLPHSSLHWLIFMDMV